MMQNISERKRKVDSADFTELPPFPREFFLDLTSHCNHKCVFCANPLIADKRTMSLERAKYFLSDCYNAGAREVGMYATGESFLVKNLENYIAAAKECGYEYVFITTNGALASKDRVRRVVEAGLDSLKFSISAGTRQTYKKIQGKDDFDKVIQNLRDAADYRETSQSNFKIYVTMVYTEETQHEVEILRELVKDCCDEWDPHPLNNQCGNMFSNNRLGSIEKGNPRGRGSRTTCFQPFFGFSITPEGYMSACVLDYSKDLIIADLNSTDATTAWNSKVAQGFRRRHLDGDLRGGICYNCINNTNEPVVPLTSGYEVVWIKK